jgi:thioredoxin 1
MAETIKTDTFEAEVLQSEKPVIVDFWAEWCGPCRAVAPVLAEIARERADDLRVVKVNIDEEPALAQRYGIMSIPTLMLFASGEEKARMVGARGKDVLLKEIEPHLG